MYYDAFNVSPNLATESVELMLIFAIDSTERQSQGTLCIEITNEVDSARGSGESYPMTSGENEGMKSVFKVCCNIIYLYTGLVFLERTTRSPSGLPQH